MQQISNLQIARGAIDYRLDMLEALEKMMEVYDILDDVYIYTDRLHSARVGWFVPLITTTNLRELQPVRGQGIRVSNGVFQLGDIYISQFEAAEEAAKAYDHLYLNLETYELCRLH